VQRELAHGTHLHAMTRHILGLFQGCPGARAFRRHLSENAPRPGAVAEVIREAMALVRDPDETALPLAVARQRPGTGDRFPSSGQSKARSV